MRTDFFKLDILSPVFIGTGEELDPMNYLMRRDKDDVACHVLNTKTWAADYPDPDELSDQFSAGNVPAMRSFLANNIDPEIYGLRRIAVSSGLIFKEYEQKLRDQSTTNQLLFSPHMTVSDCLPLLPGSSIKGALRTAVIDWVDREKHLGLKAARAKDSKGYQERLESVLGPITESAFRQLKISDTTGYADSTVMVAPMEIRRKEGKSITPKNKCEAMPSFLLGNAEQASLYTRIALGLPNNPSDRHLTLRNGHRWSWPELTSLVNAYYLKRFHEEKNKFYGLPNFIKAGPVMERLEAELQCEPGQMILRVGHYSQVEFVTVEENQPFTRRGKQGTPLPYGTTRTLANGLFPFGWVRLTPCSERDYKEGVALREKWNIETQMRRHESREKVLTEKIRRTEETQMKEEQARQQAEAEQIRKAAFEAMSPEERDIAALEAPEIIENTVVEILNRIDSFSDDNKLKAAKAIKRFYLASGKWKVKKKQQKQWEKVQKIKALLGE